MEEPKNKSALSEVNGINQPEAVSNAVAKQIQQFRRKQPSATELIDAILKGDKTALSRAITLVESQVSEDRKEANKLIKSCSDLNKKAWRIGITGVPGVLLEDMDKATFGNMEQLSQMFVNYTIMPLCETIESEFNRKIFFEVEKDKYSTRFNLDGLLRGDVAARSSYYTTMRNVLAMSPNEIRIKENMNPYPGGDSYELPLASNIKIEPTNETINDDSNDTND